MACKRNSFITHFKDQPSGNTCDNQKIPHIHNNLKLFSKQTDQRNCEKARYNTTLAISCSGNSKTTSSFERRYKPELKELYWVNTDDPQTHHHSNPNDKQDSLDIDSKTKSIIKGTQFEVNISREEIVARRKQKVAAKRQLKKEEKQQLKQIVCGVQVAKPDFSLEQAAEDFPALSCERKVKKGKCNKGDEVHAHLTPGNSCHSRPTEKSWKPKVKDPIYFNLSQALQPKPEKPKPVVKKHELPNERNKLVGNILDSDNPTLNKGKVRPNKVKKPSKLKLQILSDRNESHKILSGSKENMPIVEDSISSLYTHDFSNQISDLLAKCGFQEPNVMCHPVKENQLPINVTNVHSRKFREYCTNCITDDLVNSINNLLDKVAYFQDRTYAKDPIKANSKRRYVAGLNQTNKYLQVKKLKLIIIAPDLERSSGIDGLDEKIRRFKKEADHQGVPCVFGPNRKKLGKAVLKSTLVSCVGVLSYEGAEEQFSKVLETLHEAKLKYQDLVVRSSQIVDEQFEKANDEKKDRRIPDVTCSLLANLKEELVSPGEKLLTAINNCTY